MALILANDKGCVVDEQVYYTNLYQSLGLRYREGFYAIKEPFVMQSQFEARIRPNRRQRKKKRPQNGRPSPLLLSYAKNVESLASSLLATGKSGNAFELPPEESELSNNASARECGKAFQATVTEFLDDKWANTSLHCKGNWSHQCEIIEDKNCTVVCPPLCRYFINDVCVALNYLTTDKEKFDFIVMDPPWDNRSVRRKRNYVTKAPTEWDDLGLPAVLQENAIVAIWLTNNERIITHARQQLMRKWNLEEIGVWHWLKVTRSGQPVYNYNSDFKLPFENLLVACSRGSWLKTVVPKKRLIVSVPCAIPSHKPPLVELFKVYLGEEMKTLELFARNLLPNTTSVGKQVIAFQLTSWFENF